MKKCFRILAITGIFGLISLGGFAQEDISNQIRKMEAMIRIADHAYVDSVDGEKMVEDAIRGMLKELDPHSVYITKDEVDAMNEPLVGNFEGIGIQFNILNDTILVVAPISGGPSEKLGIRSGDKIVTIEGENVAGIGIRNSDVTDKLRGEKGTKVNVGIKRRGEKKLIDYTITRDKIPIFSVDAVYMATEKTGYIKLNRFSATSIREIHEGMEELKKRGMENLILDLRGNGGGYLKTAIDLADEFLPSQELIVYTEGRSYPKDERYATSKGMFEDGKVAILIDNGSASASEIVSGAIQDNDRGLIIGRRSFGKGLVQKPFSLPDGAVVRLTVQRYYTPSGRCIQKPYEDYKNDFMNRFESGELFNRDSIDVPDSLVFKTKAGREVYGGGGIIPDIFVPLDTTYTSDYYTDLNRKGIINEFTLNYVDRNRKKLLKSYPDIESFKTEFETDESFMDEFFKFAEKQEVPLVEEEYETSKSHIQTYLKALIARGLWKTGAFFEVINPLSPEYNKAISILESDTYEKLNINKPKE